VPFRQFYASRGSRHPLAYSMLTLAAGMFASMVISVTWSVMTIRNDQARDEARDRAAAERGRVAACATINRMVDVYSDAEQEVGRNAYQAWKDLAVTFDCARP
jgi:uncharacterized phage protein gp47/JayE